MKIRLLPLIFSVLFVYLIPQPGQSCTTFCLDQGDQLVAGKNFDWMLDDGLFIINKRNVSCQLRIKSELFL